MTKHYLNHILLCSCGCLLHTLEGFEQHKNLDHFALPEYKLSQEEKDEITRIVKTHGRLSLGRSADGREVYYFCWADIGPPRTPTLHWNENLNAASAFAKAAEDYAAGVRTAIKQALDNITV